MAKQWQRDCRWTVIEHVFYGGPVLPPDQDRITVARITGTALRHCLGRPMTGEQEAAALAALAEIADGRVDLLAQTAGLALGCHENDLEFPVHRQVAQLCVTAGADMSLVEMWIDIGRRRRAASRGHIPYTGQPGWTPTPAEARE
jgi:hypothetical protein